MSAGSDGMSSAKNYNGVRQVLRYLDYFLAFDCLKSVVRWLEFNVVCHLSDRFMTFTIMTSDRNKNLYDVPKPSDTSLASSQASVAYVESSS